MTPNPESKIVLVDMDGVLFHFDQRMEELVSERHPHIPIVTRRDHFYFYDDYHENKELVQSMVCEKGFFESLPLVEGALEGFQKILDYGYTPRICSAPIRANPWCEEEKLKSLEKYFAPVFGDWVVEQAILTRHKETANGIALIDDKPEIENSKKASWKHILFDRTYNRMTRRERLFGWKDPNLLHLLEEAERQH